MDDWQEHQYEDELLHQQEILEALRRAEAAGTPRDVLDFFAHECGVRKQFNKEKRQ